MKAYAQQREPSSGLHLVAEVSASPVGAVFRVAAPENSLPELLLASGAGSAVVTLAR